MYLIVLHWSLSCNQVAILISKRIVVFEEFKVRLMERQRFLKI